MITDISVVDSHLLNVRGSVTSLQLRDEKSRKMTFFWPNSPKTLTSGDNNAIDAVDAILEGSLIKKSKNIPGNFRAANVANFYQ